MPIMVFQCQRMGYPVTWLGSRRVTRSCSSLISLAAPTAELAVQPMVICHGSRLVRVLLASSEQGCYSQ